MLIERPHFLILLLIVSLPLMVSGCGGKPETAASPDELDSYLKANPEIANADAPEVETE